ncbi:MAG: hypothetical protein AAF430_03105 [Myxococcota bacterium]
MSTSLGALLARLQRETVALGAAIDEADLAPLEAALERRGACLEAIRARLSEEPDDAAIREVARAALEAAAPLEAQLTDRLTRVREELASVRGARVQLRQNAPSDGPRFVCERV